MPSLRKTAGPLLCLLLGCLTPIFRAQAQTSASASTDSAGLAGFFLRWDERAQQEQLNQPNWLTPVATSTARLKQEIRFDSSWQWQANGATSDNYGGSKGFTTIPFPRVEVSVNPPPYVAHHGSTARDGFGDFSLLFKFRILAANRKNGDYALTVFLATSFPTASYKNGALHPVITPTVAGGKGFGDFVYQGTFGVDLPSAQTAALGRRFLLNNAFQYRHWAEVWPEVEVNSNFYDEGPNDGKKQSYLTPGISAGRFPLYRRLQLTVGAGMEFAVTHSHSYAHQAIFTVRLPF